MLCVVRNYAFKISIIFPRSKWGTNNTIDLPSAIGYISISYCAKVKDSIRHYIIMSVMASQITGVSIVCSLFVQMQIKENIKAPRQWPLWRESTGDQWIPLTKSPLTWKMFPFVDVIMRFSEESSDGLPGHMMTSSNGNIFRVTGPLCGEFTAHWWIPLTKASDAELWCFLWSGPEQTVE